MIRVAEEVADALAEGRPVVALESTIFSHLGLPSPHNADALERCLGAVRTAGAVPAVTAVLDGVPRVGLAAQEHDRILGPATKLAERDLPVAVARGERVGATTVSASVFLAARCGIGVFATGGIGGVHHRAAETGDVSADLSALAAHSVLTVCAGAKSFLDLARTLEYLETAGVPVLGLRTDRFPAFYAAASPFAVQSTVEQPAEAAEVLLAQRGLGRTAGVVLAVPIPARHALSWDELEEARLVAEREATAAGVRGAAVTPFVLARFAEVTGGRSIPANLALAEHNAAVGAEAAVRLAAG
jgi:pseudouridylate synthase